MLPERAAVTRSLRCGDASVKACADHGGTDPAKEAPDEPPTACPSAHPAHRHAGRSGCDAQRRLLRRSRARGLRHTSALDVASGHPIRLASPLPDADGFALSIRIALAVSARFVARRPAVLA